MNTTASNARDQCCYLCNDIVTGEKVNVSTAVTPTTKTGVPEMISHLLGEEFVVVVNETDPMCRRCYSLLAHVDKLETELTGLRKTLYTIMKTKYKDLNPEDMESPQLSLGEEFPPGEEDAGTSPQQDSATSSQQDSATDSTSSISTESSDTSSDKVLGIATPPTAPSSVVAPGERGRVFGLGAGSSNLLIKAPIPGLQSSQKNTKIVPRVGTTKVKVYKCGFCAFQSKELPSVRNHMKLHLPIVPNDAKPQPTSATTPATLTTPAPSNPPLLQDFITPRAVPGNVSMLFEPGSLLAAKFNGGRVNLNASLPSTSSPTSDSNASGSAATKTALATPTANATGAAKPVMKRKVFRCQICSVAFEDRIKCLEHISKDHAPNRRGLAIANESVQKSVADIMENLAATANANASVSASDAMGNLAATANASVSASDAMGNLAATANASVSALGAMGNLMGSAGKNGSVSALGAMGNLMGSAGKNGSVSALGAMGILTGSAGKNGSVSALGAMGNLTGSAGKNGSVFALGAMGILTGSAGKNGSVSALGAMGNLMRAVGKNRSVSSLDAMKNLMGSAGAFAATSSESLKSSSESLCEEPSSKKRKAASTALYSCDSCSETFDNDISFAGHLNEHINAQQMRVDCDAASGEQHASGGAVGGADKDGSMDADIEAMIAAFRSEADGSADL